MSDPIIEDNIMELREIVPQKAMVMRAKVPATDIAKALGTILPEIAGYLHDKGAAPPRASVGRVYPAVSGGQMSADVPIPGLASTMVGRRVTARVAVGERQALVVPRRFVETSYGIDYVTIIVGKDATSRVPVQIAPTDDPARVEILSGAGKGDTLIAVARGAAGK